MVEGAPKRYYRSAHAALRLGDLSQAAAAFAAESRWYQRMGLGLLALHAWTDAERTFGGAMEEISVLTPPDRIEHRVAPGPSRPSLVS
jgi:hypothetical protein